MISPYEVASLCAHVYRPDHEVLPMSYSLAIEDAGEWGVEAHVGVSNSFFVLNTSNPGLSIRLLFFEGLIR